MDGFDKSVSLSPYHRLAGCSSIMQMAQTKRHTRIRQIANQIIKRGATLESDAADSISPYRQITSRRAQQISLRY